MTPIKVSAESTKLKIDATFKLTDEDDLAEVIEQFRSTVELRNAMAELRRISGRSKR